MPNKLKKNPVIFLILIFLLATMFFGIVDAQNKDNDFYQFFHIGPLLYYDLPIWEFLVAFGTISAAGVALYAGYKSIKIEEKQSQQIGRQLRIEQEPHVVIDDRIFTAGSGRNERLFSVNLTNVGRGSAITITLTADSGGKISIIEGSRPNSINLPAGKPFVNWSIDEGQIIKGIKEQRKDVVDSIVRNIPHEESLGEDEKDRSEFHLFVWYEDGLGNKYRTKTKIRHALVNSAHFFKVMENKGEMISGRLY